MKNLLDNLAHIQKIDKSDMLDILMDFPEQLRQGFQLADGVSFAKGRPKISNVVFSGVGGSAIAGDVVRTCVLDEMKVPLIVNREYLAPGYAGPATVMFVSSYSGNTEETISSYIDAKKKKARIIVLTSGGKLEKLARADGYPVIKMPQGLPPRCALGYSFAPALFVLSKLGLIKPKEGDMSAAVKTIIGVRDKLVGQAVPSKDNPAKRIARALAGRFCAIYGGSRNLDCVITRWRNQLNENSKSIAQSHFLPEMDHNEIMGFSYPKDLLKRAVVIFLKDRQDHARVRDRIRITGSIIRGSVSRIIEVASQGSGLISRICSLIYIGDFVSFYLAILNTEDPTPVDEIARLKRELEKIKYL